MPFAVVSQRGIDIEILTVRNLPIPPGPVPDQFGLPGYPASHTNRRFGIEVTGPDRIQHQDHALRGIIEDFSG